MHHVVVERWSRGRSPVHSRDARTKVILLAAYLVALATMPRLGCVSLAAYAALAIAAALLARLPLGGVLARAAVVLPFTATFAVLSAISGDHQRAFALLGKSYLSALAVLVLIGTTPLPNLLRGIESLGVPRLLALVVQFLYRYLFVISEEAQHMRASALSRGGSTRAAFSGFRQATGAVSVLFAKSYRRAEAVHHAMLARGYAGQIRLLAPHRLAAADYLSMTVGLAAIAAMRLALGRAG